MGRPPCCEKIGIKKGPWTPEEDIILVSYIQEHGPGNWRSVPTNTGLLRCSKSCRLRWTNYLRPGIRRGNFTSHEEGMIIHLQSLLGNKWAAIASYLPQRTDNDVKNYWNTHIKKKLTMMNNKSQFTPLDTQMGSDPDQFPFSSTTFFNDKMRSSSSNNGSNNSTYASSTENISRLLEGWMKSSSSSISSSPKVNTIELTQGKLVHHHHHINNSNLDSSHDPPPMKFFENWLLGGNGDEHVEDHEEEEEEDILDLPSMF